MSSYDEFYRKRLYPFQDGILSTVRVLNTPFYLTGGTALSRHYYNHRYSDDLVIFINDDSNEVGRVHFGIVYEYSLDDSSFGRKYKQGHEKISFAKISELLTNIDDYESWSRILIEDYLQP